MQYFKEALLFISGKNLHAFYAILFIHGEIIDAIAIWDTFANHFITNYPIGYKIGQTYLRI